MGRGLPLLLPPPLDLDGGGRDTLERPRCVQDGSKSASESPRWHPRWLKTAQDASRWPRRCSKRPQDRPKTAPRGKIASQGGLQDAKILQKPKGNQCFLPSRLFASDGHPRPQDGSKKAQEGPKRGPREPQDGPKSAQERSKSGPRAPQEAILEAPEGGP